MEREHSVVDRYGSNERCTDGEETDGRQWRIKWRWYDGREWFIQCSRFWQQRFIGWEQYDWFHRWRHAIALAECPGVARV